MHFVIYGHSWCFSGSQIALACGPRNFENLPIYYEMHPRSYDFLYIYKPSEAVSFKRKLCTEYCRLQTAHPPTPPIPVPFPTPLSDSWRW